MGDREEGAGAQAPTPPTYLAAIDAIKGDQMAMLALLRRIRPRLVTWFERRLGPRRCWPSR
jgi:hypothetical protein